MSENYLFSRGYLRDYLEHKKLEIKEEIYKLDEDYILNVSEEDLVRAIVKKYTLNHPVLKLEEKYLLEPKEIDIDARHYDYGRFILNRNEPFYIKGTQITLVIPLEGDEELFYYQPSTFSTIIPQGVIYNNELHLNYKVTNHDSDLLKREIDQDIQRIQSYLKWVENDVNNFNNSLENYIRNLIKTRKEKLLKDRNLVSSLDIPIKRREDIRGTFSIPITPKRIKIELPKVKAEKFKPEPALSMEIYNDVIERIQSMSIAIERSPKTFSRMKEEQLRDLLLVILNAHYEGQAMGEVFNNLGKTDILIRYENANVFIAECKFWKGEKKLLKTIDQLLKYVTWRDTKTAIILFNREGDLTEILEKIPEIVKKHPCCKRDMEIKTGETYFKYVFHHPDDRNREIILTIMVFNIPKL